ncbi:putative phospholipid-transporting ATPase (DRS2) [Vairimorpha necatrix]|uniref:Phospholipid-transporting ATPase (DRS2) n=1 Tax=Vairimorpha necatrix TaxID=6039 RepID=A0AAX4J9B6_9MICR
MKKENRIITSKYNKYTFFFVNMYHQLSKPSNLFFLLTMVLLTIPQISPFNPYTYLLAFSLVTGTSMIKDGIEDYKRHKEDKIVNMKIINVAYIEDKMIYSKEIHAEDIKQGDFVILKPEEEIPGDCVLLLSKIKEKCKGYCFVDTSNLDGESNLKKKTSHTVKDCLQNCAESRSDQMSYDFCQCEYDLLENVKNSTVKDTGDVFNKFECTLTTQDREFLCNERNILLRGMKLKNVDSALVYIVAVGGQTKLGKSNVMPRKGTSLFEMELTKIVMIIFVIYFVLLCSTAILGSLFLRKNNLQYLYLGTYLSSDALKLTGTNYIMFSYLIPLSLFVTLEVSRMFHALYISHDENLERDGIKSVCRNSNVTEDLGMIEYILSDKTGTLTKNKMVFKKIHVLGSEEIIDVSELKFNFSNIDEISDLIKFSNVKDEVYRNFFLTFLLLCCNSVEPLNGKLEGISQDEICILQKLEANGIQLLRREEDFLLLKIGNINIKCNIEYILDFSSSRQRMSVIVKFLDKIFMFSKGSDQMMLDEKKINVKILNRESVSKIVNKNSSYRTLICAYREITNEELINLKNDLESVNLEDHEEKEDFFFKKLEKNLEYIGTTFIEDELQDEVKETIEMLKEAGIKIWMITGDKKETALSCAIDSGLMTNLRDNSVISIEGRRVDEELRNPNILSYKSVIIYRSTPKQKSQIALILRNFKKNTLAIGDGNNDVPMLLTSHVGVGILGKEGNQAGISADFAVPDFRSLKYLIFIHGRYNFIRFSKVTLNGLYKNIYLIIIQYLYNFYTGFSGKPVYNNFFLNYYNVLFTSLIPATICCFDKDLPEDYLLRNPREYKSTTSFFCKSVIFLGIIYGIIQGLVVFLLVLGVFFIKDLVRRDGKVAGYNGMNNLMSLIVFFSVFLGQIRLISFYTIYSYVAIFLSLLLLFLTLFVIQDTSLGGNMWILMSIPSAYFTFLFIMLFTYISELCLSKIFYKLVNKKEIN